MISHVSDNLDKLRALCRKHRAKTLWLFGSAVRDDFDRGKGDVDALVVFDEMDYRRRAEHYYALRDEISQLLGRPVDLIEDEAITNPFFRAEVDRSRVLI